MEILNIGDAAFEGRIIRRRALLKDVQPRVEQGSALSKAFSFSHMSASADIAMGPEFCSEGNGPGVELFYSRVGLLQFDDLAESL
jgi:hypothetical protein